jgi:hypothetical protein
MMSVQLYSTVRRAQRNYSTVHRFHVKDFTNGSSNDHPSPRAPLINDSKVPNHHSVMFAARLVSSLLLRRCALLSRAAPSSLTLTSGYASLRLPHPIPAGMISLSPVTHQPSWVFQQLAELVDSAIFQMSSTLKKRRSKMNKHKLRKRRKLLRRKSN